jgi:hypothetical protein
MRCRAVAERAAQERGEACGDTCGYAIRLESKASARTQVRTIDRRAPPAPAVASRVFDAEMRRDDAAPRISSSAENQSRRSRRAESAREGFAIVDY